MEESSAAKTNNKRFRKDKPWDHEGIDHWKVDPVDAEENRLPAPIVESSFATLFPKYREKYIREVIFIILLLFYHHHHQQQQHFNLE